MSRRFHPLMLAACALAAMVGCDATGARYVPDAELARASLESALTAWRDGRPCGPVGQSPTIQVSDSRWRDGQRIESFRIGEEQPGGDGPRQFPVKLTLKKTGKVEEIRYIVHGRDPVWIYSDADYRRMIDMGNGAEPAPRRGPRRSGR